MYRQIQTKMRECSNGKAIIELKEELVKLKEAHSEEICSLEDKVKKIKDKYSAKKKEQGTQEEIVQDKVAFLEKKLKKHETFYATEVVELKEALNAKVWEVENLKGEVAEQYTEGFDEALNQVKFLFANLDVSSCGYFKEIQNGQLVDKTLPGAKPADVEGGNHIRTPQDVVDLVARGKDRADDSPTAKFLFLLYLNNTFFFMYILDICPAHLFPSFNFIFSSSLSLASWQFQMCLYL